MGELHKHRKLRPNTAAGPVKHAPHNYQAYHRTVCGHVQRSARGLSHKTRSMTSRHERPEFRAGDYCHPVIARASEQSPTRGCVLISIYGLLPGAPPLERAWCLWFYRLSFMTLAATTGRSFVADV